jgi:hypothetical protein
MLQLQVPTMLHSSQMNSCHDLTVSLVSDLDRLFETLVREYIQCIAVSLPLLGNSNKCSNGTDTLSPSLLRDKTSNDADVNNDIPLSPPRLRRFHPFRRPLELSPTRHDVEGHDTDDMKKLSGNETDAKSVPSPNWLLTSSRSIKSRSCKDSGDDSDDSDFTPTVPVMKKLVPTTSDGKRAGRAKAIGKSKAKKKSVGKTKSQGITSATKVMTKSTVTNGVVTESTATSSSASSKIVPLSPPLLSSTKAATSDVDYTVATSNDNVARGSLTSISQSIAHSPSSYPSLPLPYGTISSTTPLIISSLFEGPSRGSRSGNGTGRKLTKLKPSDDERKLFEEGLELYGRDWEKLATHVGTRTPRAMITMAHYHFKELQEAGKPLPAKVRESSDSYRAAITTTKRRRPITGEGDNSSTTSSTTFSSPSSSSSMTPLLTPNASNDIDMDIIWMKKQKRQRATIAISKSNSLSSDHDDSGSHLYDVNTSPSNYLSNVAMSPMTSLSSVIAPPLNDNLYHGFDSISIQPKNTSPTFIDSNIKLPVSPSSLLKKANRKRGMMKSSANEVPLFDLSLPSPSSTCTLAINDVIDTYGSVANEDVSNNHEVASDVSLMSDTEQAAATLTVLATSPSRTGSHL